MAPLTYFFNKPKSKLALNHIFLWFPFIMRDNVLFFYLKTDLMNYRVALSLICQTILGINPIMIVFG